MDPVLLRGIFIHKSRATALEPPRRPVHAVKGVSRPSVHAFTRLNAVPSLSVVLNLQPEPEVRRTPRRPVKEYRLFFLIGSVTTEWPRQQMRTGGNRERERKKMLWGLKCHVNSWIQPPNTSGVLSTL